MGLKLVPALVGFTGSVAVSRERQRKKQQKSATKGRFFRSYASRRVMGGLEGGCGTVA